MVKVDSAWYDHARRIYENWHRVVTQDDVVLVPGDISWALKLDETQWDFEFLKMLPGRMVCVQGNHDYWWQSISKLRATVPPNMLMIQNDHVDLGSIKICGTRGWVLPGSAAYKEEDGKIYRRELIRMEISLQSAGKGRKVAMMHYMPTSDKHEYSEFIRLFEKYEVSTVVYGHLHAQACRFRLPDRAWGIDFHLVSADYLDFTPKLISNL